jgi:MFS family permease
VLGALALAAIGRISTLTQLYLVYAFFGAGHAFAALVPATTLVTRWFERQRALALSITSTGLSIGGVALTPLSATLIDSLGLGVAMPRLALLWLLGIVPLTLLVVRDRPVARDTAELEATGIESGWTAAVAFRSRLFLLLTGAWILAMLAQVGGIAHLFNLVATRVGSGTGATAVSLMASASIVGRFAGGWLLMYVDTRRFALVCFMGQTLAMLALALFADASWLLLSAVLFGLTVGNLLMLQPLLLAEVFGVRDYGRIFSVSQLLTTIGVAMGPLIMGLLYDALGGYLASFVAAGLASSIGMMLLLLARLPASTSQPSGQASPT